MATSQNNWSERLATPVQMSPDIIVCGHRGGGGDPENTDILTAGADWSHLNGKEPDHYEKRDAWANRKKTFERMLEQGVRCFEFDLLTSKDGTVMVVHNTDINDKHVWTYTAEQLKALGCMEFKELLDLVETFQKKSGEKVKLLVELKGSFSSETVADAGKYGVHPKSSELVRKTSDMIKEKVTNKTHGWDYEQFMLIGFNHEMLKEAKRYNKEIPIGFSFAPENFGDSPLPQTDTDAVRGKYNKKIFDQVAQATVNDYEISAINPDSRFVDAGLVKEARKRGLKVQIWSDYGVKENPEIMKMADTWITDWPLNAKKQLENLSKTQQEQRTR